VKVVFICGPYRAPTPWGVECNIRRAEELALKVAESGCMPLCPHTGNRFFDKLLTDDFWLKGTTELLKRCDGVALVDGWERSTGSRAEQITATGLGLRQFGADLDGMKEWA
jgi:hypothetical protein